jgi:hypothetical protein
MSNSLLQSNDLRRKIVDAHGEDGVEAIGELLPVIGLSADVGPVDGGRWPFSGFGEQLMPRRGSLSLVDATNRFHVLG